MAYLDFFAARDDLFALFDFLFAETDVRVFDLYSDFGEGLREYTSAKQIDAVHQIGLDQTGIRGSVPLTLWSPSAVQTPTIKTMISHLPDLGARQRLEAAGLMQLYLGGVKEYRIAKTHFGHYEEKGARVWWGDATNLTDWVMLAKTCRKIQYHIRKRLAVTGIENAPLPILPHALRLLQQGYIWEDFAPRRFAPALRAGETVTPAKWLREGES